jgi:hypothetical protein
MPEAAAFLSIQLLIERNGDRVLKILNGGPLT